MPCVSFYLYTKIQYQWHEYCTWWFYLNFYPHIIRSHTAKIWMYSTMWYRLVNVVSCDKIIIYHIMIYLNRPPSSANPRKLFCTTQHDTVSLTINPENFLNRSGIYGSRFEQTIYLPREWPKPDITYYIIIIYIGTRNCGKNPLTRKINLQWLNFRHLKQYIQFL